jgi:hypothetical protein
MIRNLIFLGSFALLFGFQLKAQTADQFLNDFLVVQIDDHVFIRWTIKAGNTCSGTRIEHSSDGIAFRKIGEIPGICGSPDVSVTYDFTDSMPLPNRKNYYRLEMGVLGLSSPAMVEVVFLNEEGYSIQPNPVTGQSKFVFDNDGGEEHEFCLIDTYGRQVMAIITSEASIIIDRQLLAPGTYVFKLIHNGQVKAIGKLMVI